MLSFFRGDGAVFVHPPRIYSFSGKNLLTDMTWPTKAVWHGALMNGQRVLDISCDAWHSGSRSKRGFAGSLHGSRLLEQSSYPCDQKLAVLCVEVTTETSKERSKREIDSR